MSNQRYQFSIPLLKRMGKYCALCVFLVLVSCQKQVEHGGKSPLVQVGNRFLYQEDVKALLPYGITSADSIDFVQRFVRKWVEDQILYEKAELNVRGDENIERMVADYRRTLVMNTYERELLQEKISSELPEEDFRKYYDSNKELFILEEPVIKGVFIKAPLTSPGLKDLKKWYKDKSEKSLEQLEKYAFRNAVLYEYFYEHWVPVSELEGKVVFDLSKYSANFEKYRNIEVEKGGYCYLLHVEEYVMAGKVKPYELARHEIVDLLINNRKVEFMDRVREDLYNQSVEMGRIKYYYNETTQTLDGNVHHADDGDAIDGTR